MEIGKLSILLLLFTICYQNAFGQDSNEVEAKDSANATSFTHTISFRDWKLDKLRVYPAERLYIGIETGYHRIETLYQGGVTFSRVLGISAEYFATNNFTIKSGIKLLKTGTSFYYPDVNTTELFGFKRSEYYGSFENMNIVLPLTFHYDFRIIKNIRANIGIGSGLSVELNRNFKYSPNLGPNFQHTYPFFNFKTGISCFLTNRFGLYVDFDFIHFQNSKARVRRKFGYTNHASENTVFAIGVNYSISKIR